MTVFAAFDSAWGDAFAFVLVLVGMALVWRGLRGGRDGAQAVMRARTDMLGRIEGFRLMMAGLVAVGIGVALAWQAWWLLWLAIGIGFVEIAESSALIAVWKRFE